MLFGTQDPLSFSPAFENLSLFPALCEKYSHLLHSHNIDADPLNQETVLHFIAQRIIHEIQYIIFDRTYWNDQNWKHVTHENRKKFDEIGIPENNSIALAYYDLILDNIHVDILKRIIPLSEGKVDLTRYGLTRFPEKLLTYPELASYLNDSLEIKVPAKWFSDAITISLKKHFQDSFPDLTLTICMDDSLHSKTYKTTGSISLDHFPHRTQTCSAPVPIASSSSECHLSSSSPSPEKKSWVPLQRSILSNSRRPKFTKRCATPDLPIRESHVLAKNLTESTAPAARAPLPRTHESLSEILRKLAEDPDYQAPVSRGGNPFCSDHYLHTQNKFSNLFDQESSSEEQEETTRRTL